MRFWRLIKLNLLSIPKQQKILDAIKNNDSPESTKLIAESIRDILQAGLMPNQLNILEEISNSYREETKSLLGVAFQRGWMRDGQPNLSNAMDEVQKEAIELINLYKEYGLDQYKNFKFPAPPPPS